MNKLFLSFLFVFLLSCTFGTIENKGLITHKYIVSDFLGDVHFLINAVGYRDPIEVSIEEYIIVVEHETYYPF